MEAASTGERPHRRNRGIAIAIVLIVALAGVLCVWTYEITRPSSAGPVNDGPTFYQALSAQNESVRNQSGGPWTLFNVFGIAAPIPFSPNALGWINNQATINACGAQFDGLTLWNGTIPIFTGSFDSGTAPFWQFNYFSNASHDILTVTDVEGAVRVFSPISMTSTCALASNMGLRPWVAAQQLSPLPADSPVMARSAWNAIGQRWTGDNRPAYERFTFGGPAWGSGNPGGLIVGYGRCGELGVTGGQPVAFVSVAPDGSWENFFNGSQGCGNANPGPPVTLIPYGLRFSTPTLQIGGGATRINAQFLVALGVNATGGYTDAFGLVSWMADLDLANSTGQRLPSVTSPCGQWVASVSECPASSSGWYAVLQSSYGLWLDSYPVNASGSSWENLMVSLVSNQTLVIIAPESWNVAGDTLSITGTSPQAMVSGSVAI
jgi:hypothetical protein